MSPLPTTSADLTKNGDLPRSNSIFEIDHENDFSRFSEVPRPISIERKRSFDEKSFSELSITKSPRPFYRNSENSSRVFEPVDSVYSSGGRSVFDTPRSQAGFETHPIVSEAWEALRKSMVFFRGQPVGTIAALDNSEEELNYDQVIDCLIAMENLLNVVCLAAAMFVPLSRVNLSSLHMLLLRKEGIGDGEYTNFGIDRMSKGVCPIYYYRLFQLQSVEGNPIDFSGAYSLCFSITMQNQVFVRDFVPSALAFLMNGEPEIVKNFLLKTLHLQSWEKKVDLFKLGEGVMPASFKVKSDPVRKTETLVADFGETAIGRVAPVDSGFWWIILLRAYTKSTGDSSLADMADCQRGIRLILSLCLSKGFDTFPTLLCADGCSMIDRRMGIYGYPIEIQALFFMSLRCALQLLKPEGENKELIGKIVERLHALSYHMRTYYWLDLKQLNCIYRYKTEEYSHTAVNKFNVMPDSLPDWVFDFMPCQGGYFTGNVSPAFMDFRWFCIGNCVAILSSLATPDQASAIMDLIEARWDDIVGEMPLKICYPALEGHEWKIITGYDPKNTRWSYHNGGSWPVLLWLLTAACIKSGRPHIARRAIELAEARLLKDSWPEYYDGKHGRFIGKQARKNQTWSIAGYLVAKMLLEDPSHVGMVSLEEDKLMTPLVKRSCSWTC